LIPFSKLIHH